MLSVYSWNVRRIRKGAWAEFADTLAEAAARLHSSPWQVVCIQEPGNLNSGMIYPHKYVGRNSRGFGAAIIIHADIACKISYEHSDQDWALAVLDFSAEQQGFVVIISIHAPTHDKGLEDYSAFFQDILLHIKKIRGSFPQARIFASCDANVELPELTDLVFKLTGPACCGEYSDRGGCFLELHAFSEPQGL